MKTYKKPITLEVELQAQNLLASSYDATVEKTSERASTEYEVLTRRKSSIWDGQE